MRGQGSDYMTETIYGDVLFIINFSMDFLSLYITGKIMKIKPRAWRMILSASVGGIYGVASLFFYMNGVFVMMLNIVCAILMCFIAFFKGKIAQVLLSGAVFYGVGMLLGGIMTLIYSKLGKYTGYISIGGSIATVFGEIPLWLFAVLACISAVITFFLGRIFKSKQSVTSAEVMIRFGEKTAIIECLVDSGNLLCEPISGTPVIFISVNAADIVPERLLCVMREGGATFDIDIMKKIRFVPTSSLGGEKMTVCAVPDSCTVKGEERRALIAVDYSNTNFGGYNGLVPGSLL